MITRRLLPLLVCAIAAVPLQAQITIVTRGGSSLGDRIDAASTGGGGWIGYAVRRLMERNTYMSTHWMNNGSRGYPSTLDDALAAAGDSAAASSERATRSRVGRDDERVAKRVAILVKLAGGSPVEVEYQTTDVTFEPAGRAIRWLGEATTDESVRQLMRWYEREQEPKLQERYVRVIGLHQSGTDVEATFLSGVLKSGANERVRRVAAQALGEFPSHGTLTVLASCVRNDASRAVARAAVWALGEQPEPAATDSIIALIDGPATVQDVRIRKEAVMALARRAAERSVPALKGIIESDPDADVRTMAVWSLANINDGSGVTSLIDLARNHVNPAIRKQAIYALAQSRDERAVAAIIELARK